MRSLDTLSPLRPKPESGPASAGEDPRAGGAPDFEAMLGALESGTESGSAPTGESPPRKTETGADTRPADPAGPLLMAGTDASGSALQALMALAGAAAPTAAAVGPDAALDAMVQRAVARAGAGASSVPAEPTVQISMVGLETHFAPVRPRGATPSTEAGSTGPGASIALPAFPAPESIGGTPAAARSLARAPSRAAIALEAGAPSQEPTGATSGLLRPSPDPLPATLPPGDTRHAGGESDRPALVQREFAAASRDPVNGPSTTVVTPRPVPPDPAATAQPPALAAAAQAAVPGALRSPTERGRAALSNDPAEPAGAAETVPLLPDQGAHADLTEPAAVTRPGTAGQAQRGPEPARERPTGVAPSEAASVRDTTSMPRVEASSEHGVSAGTDTATTEAPRLEQSLAEPVPQTAASAAASAAAPAPASPLRQIVDAVSAQLPAAPAAQAHPFPGPAEAGPLKILTLQLHPADLGSVLVRMRLQDGRLEMSLRTSREETAERLRKEGDLLSGLLREAGYEPDTVTIQSGGASLGESGSRGQGFASFAGSQGGQHDRQPGAATPDHSGRRPSPRADEAVTPTEEQNHETDSRGRDRGSLYL